METSKTCISYEVVFCLELLDYQTRFMPSPIGAYKVDGLPYASMAELPVTMQDLRMSLAQVQYIILFTGTL